jgi:CMP-N,N'-diacetyllegionaminic acid synthase
MRILGLIPARGGSKGVPRKNIRLLNGKPLLAYTAEAALAATSLTRVILSTEDQEIASIGQQYGVDVPFLRPLELAQDDTPTLPVVEHALLTLAAQGELYDAICLLQPVNPLRRVADIEACAQLFNTSGAETVLSVLPVPHEYNPHWVYFAAADGSLHLSTGEAMPIPRRQLLPAAFHRDGSIYITRTAVVLDQHSLYGQRVLGYEMHPDYSINIDTWADWQRIEARLQQIQSSATS